MCGEAAITLEFLVGGVTFTIPTNPCLFMSACGPLNLSVIWTLKSCDTFIGLILGVLVSRELSVFVPVGLFALPGGLDPDMGLVFFILKEDTCGEGSFL